MSAQEESSDNLTPKRDTAMDATMLPADQVASIVQQMKNEQERLLEQQREIIVQQVMQSLRESGAVLISDSEKCDTSQSIPIKKGQAQRSPMRLDKNLHSLVTHSLEQSGLQFPHVHQTTYEPRSRETKSQQRGEQPKRSETCKRKTVDGGKTVIITRKETTLNEASDGEEDSFERGERRLNHGEERSVQSESRRRRSPGERGRPAQKMRENQAAAALCQSPLGIQVRGSRRRRRRGEKIHEHSATHEDAGNSCTDPRVRAVDTAFAAVRGKVGHKTLAILERSRVLLDQANRSGATRTASGDTFVARMRQQTRQGSEENDTGEEVDGAPRNEIETNAEGGNTCEEMDAFPSNELVEEWTDRVDGKQDEGALPTRAKPTELVAKAKQALPCDMEMLRPPERAPENEEDWENELARQILTIYATSVKAKANKQERPVSSSTTATAATTRRSPSPSTPGSLNYRECPMRKQPTPPRLGTSCSLPVIPRSRSSPGKVTPAAAAVQYSWEPSQKRLDGTVVVNMPTVPRPIWFAGTGSVKAVWCALAQGFQSLQSNTTDGSTASPSSSPPKYGTQPSRRNSTTGNTVAICEHRLCEEIRQHEARQQYSQCITTLETLLISLVRARGAGELEVKLWKQLVVTCNAFASRCVDYKKFARALQLIKLAEHLIHNSILVSDTTRVELLAYLYDTYAHYYYRRRKPHAGLQYILKAHEIHVRQSSWAHLAKCRLHLANLLSYQGQHSEALAALASILELIEDNKLEEPNSEQQHGGGASAQKICLVAVCYNNLAVEQLHLRAFEDASVATGNAKRLAKMCLSYSNRWLAQFEATNDCVDLAIATLMETINSKDAAT